jgi:predicted O-methyltransferase YrrM
MTTYDYKIKNFLEEQIKDIKNPIILEFGVKEGRSTKMFLDLCEKNDGKLYSIDIDDYSNLYKNSKWTFLNTRDDNFDYLEEKLPIDFDIIYLDSLHEAKHVEKIFYHYFKKLKINGFFFIDDISWLPYLKNQEKNNFYCELNNKETFEKILNIYFANQENFDLSFSFISSGLCKIFKKKNLLNKPIVNQSREFSFKNFIRKISKF